MVTTLFSSQVQTKKCALSIVKHMSEQDFNYDVLIGNAGVIAEKKKFTPEGLEWSFGVNHIGHFTFILSYLNEIEASRFPKRIVLTSSAAHMFVKHDPDFKDYNYDNRKWSTIDSYSMSKFANAMFSRKLAQLVPEIEVFSVHPGCVQSDLQRDLKTASIIVKIIAPIFQFFLRSKRAGCQSLLYAGFSNDDELSSNSGGYVMNCRIAEDYATTWSRRQEFIDSLWAKSEQITKLKLNGFK